MALISKACKYRVSNKTRLLQIVKRRPRHLLHLMLEASPLTFKLKTRPTQIVKRRHLLHLLLEASPLTFSLKTSITRDVINIFDQIFRICGASLGEHPFQVSSIF